MPLTGDKSINPDKTENYTITGIKENDTNTVSVTGFVTEIRKDVDLLKPYARQYNSAGLNVGVENSAGSLNLSGTHLPGRANVVTGSTNLHLVNTEDHRLTANAFTTSVMPKAGPNYGVHGGGLDYSYKNTLGANASVSHTPLFKQTDYSVGGTMNLHQTPTSSFGFNLGARRSDTQFGRGNWQPGASFVFQKRF